VPSCHLSKFVAFHQAAHHLQIRPTQSREPTRSTNVLPQMSVIGRAVSPQRLRQVRGSVAMLAKREMRNAEIGARTHVLHNDTLSAHTLHTDTLVASRLMHDDMRPTQLDCRFHWLV
jgi:hypothetical protein